MSRHDRLFWFPYYPADFEEGTSDFTLAEVGAYQRLLNYQWAKDGIPADNITKLATILRCTAPVARSVWRTIADKFVRGDDGLWRNTRLGDERAKVFALRAAAQENGTKGARKRWRIDSHSIDSANGESDGGTNGESIAELESHTQEHPPHTPPTGGTSALRQRFDAFWAEYPQKKAKGAAWKTWRRLKPDAALLARMLEAVREQGRSRQWREGFIPHPATWLNQERWSDEVAEGVQSDARGRRAIECARCGSCHWSDEACPMVPALIDEEPSVDTARP